MLRHRRLARTGNAGDQEHQRRRHLHDALGNREIARARLLLAHLLGGRTVRLAAADQRDQGAHQRAIHRIEPQGRQASVIAGRLQVAIEQPCSELWQTVIEEIHPCKCDVAHHVDEAQLGIEFDAIERHRLAVDQRQVGQMQIAVALPHESLGAACSKNIRTARELGFGPLREPVNSLLSLYLLL